MLSSEVPYHDGDHEKTEYCLFRPYCIRAVPHFLQGDHIILSAEPSDRMDMTIASLHPKSIYQRVYTLRVLYNLKRPNWTLGSRLV